MQYFIAKMTSKTKGVSSKRETSSSHVLVIYVWSILKGRRTALNDSWIHLQHTRIAVAFACWDGLIVFKPKSKFNPCWQMRQLYTYVADESARRLVEDGMSTGLTKKKKAREYSVLCHVFARKQCILCSGLRHKSYLTLTKTALCYMASSFILPWNFRARAIRLPPRSLASFARLFDGNYDIFKPFLTVHLLNSRHPVIKSKFCACAVTGLSLFSSLSSERIKLYPLLSL